MKNTEINRKLIIKIADGLEELLPQVIFVGGATVSLYVDDPAADDVRPTKDLDLSLSVATASELEEMRMKLNEKGFQQSSFLDVICRFEYDGILVDVMNTQPIFWAPANPWFEGGFKNSISIAMDGRKIRIMPFNYFLASKFAAYTDRGGNNPVTSSDFEDIVYLLDNRTDWTTSIKNEENTELKKYLLEHLNNILTNRRMQEAVEANLFYETRDLRYKMILRKLEEIIDKNSNF